MERLFSVEEAAKALGGVSPLTVAGWCAKGRLARTKIGRRTMISESELTRFVRESNHEEATPGRSLVALKHREMMTTRKVGKSSKPAKSEDARITKESVRLALFIAEYPKDMNATKAAERAGYKWPDKIGPRLLKHPAVKAAIGSQVQEKVQAAGLTVDRTIEEVRRLAFFDPLDIFEDDGTVRQMKHISPEARECIAGVEVIELFEGTGDEKHCFGILKKTKFHDKNSSLDKSMRYHSLYKDKVALTGPPGIIQLVSSILRPPREGQEQGTTQTITIFPQESDGPTTDEQ